MTYAFETELATKFFTPGRPGKPEFIVIHWWGDNNVTFDAIVNFLASPTKTREVSAHYAVQGTDRDGTINPRVAQIVNDEDTAWHAGNWTANQKSIGIECRTEARQADYETVAELVRNLRKKHGDIPLRRHNEFAGTDCPGGYDLSKIDELARKEETTTMASCKRVTWRGVIVCEHSVPKYNAWAASTGNDILLKPLPGCGSYQTSTTASAGTHAGGGAIDIDTRSVPSDKRKWVADKGRTSGLQVSWHRDYRAGLWTWHIHALDPSCPNLAKAAVSQIVEFGGGGDGLLGTRADANTRVNVVEIMAIFTKRLFTEVAESVSNAVRVQNLQKAVRRPVDGIWGVQTDIDLRNTVAVAKEAFSGVYFKRWTLEQRKRMQKTWGAHQDGAWGPATKASAISTTKSIQSALSVPADGVWGPMSDTAYNSLRSKMYKAPVAPAPKPPAPAISTATFKVGLTSTITVANVRIGKKNTDISRYQAALWNKCAPATRANWAKKWGITSRMAVIDGVYGKATADLTRIMYAWLYSVDKRKWPTPTATEPGKGMLTHVGFRSVR